jgi:hypothetical protein
MKNFVVESGDFITTSGIYRMNDHPGREITLIHGDAVPGKKGHVSAHPRCKKSQARLKRWNSSRCPHLEKETNSC